MLEPRLHELTRSIERECRLLDALRQALVAQRAAVAADDAASVGDSVTRIGRTLQQLDEARREQTAIVAAIGGAGAVCLDDLDAVLAGPLPPALVAAREELRRRARAAALEVAVNQDVLLSALEAGDAWVQQRFAGVP